MSVLQKPPIGVMPRYIWDAKRKQELGRAIYEYLNGEIRIIPEWVEEYNEICAKEAEAALKKGDEADDI